MLAGLLAITGFATPAAQAADTSLPVHDLITEPTVPPQYGAFSFNTVGTVTDSQITDVDGFTKGNPGGILASFNDRTWLAPTRKGATLTINHVGQWAGPSGKQWVNARVTVNNWFDSYLYVTGDQQQEGSLNLPHSFGIWNGATNPNKVRPFLDVTIDFTLDDGSKPGPTFRGVTGFVDLDGSDRTGGQNEAIELISGFDGVWKRSDAHLAPYGTNGWAGTTDLNQNVDDEHGMKHYVAATFSTSTIRIRRSCDEYHALAGEFMPIKATIAYPLTYDGNGATSGTLPQQTN